MIVKREIIDHPLFKIIGECGDNLNMETFVIGGWVRDYFLKRNSKEKEFDIPVFFLHEKYADMNIWKDRLHIANNPKSIIIIFLDPIFSLKKINAKNAVIKGIELKVNRVFPIEVKANA